MGTWIFNSSNSLHSMLTFHHYVLETSTPNINSKFLLTYYPSHRTFPYQATLRCSQRWLSGKCFHVGLFDGTPIYKAYPHVENSIAAKAMAPRQGYLGTRRS